MQQHFIERAAALPSKARVADSRRLWPTRPTGAGRSLPQGGKNSATAPGSQRKASLSKQQGEAQREQVAEEQWRKRREHWRTGRKAVLLSTLGRG